MDRLKRTLSFRKRKDHLPESSKKSPWEEDATKVRQGTCSFQVRYLGCIEVFESRGMTVCEEACKALRTKAHRSVWSRMSIRKKKKERKEAHVEKDENNDEVEQSKGKYQRAILYVSGEALRVVDEINKGLILDQTIEKVSFCAPDPHNSKGFSYICRDGTSRRWMCHGFLAVKDSGERLSHAVGVAFTVCLEKKQEREKEAVSVAFNDKGTSFTRTGSFRQATLTERLEDPQSAIVAEPVPQKHIFNPYAVQRPHAKDAMLERQGSFRGFTKLAETSPFKRQLSLRLNELPSTIDRQKQVLNQSSVDFSPIEEASPSKEDLDSIAAMCQEVSQGLTELSGPKAANNNVGDHAPATQAPSIPEKNQEVSQNNPWATTDAESWLKSTVAASPFSSPAPTAPQQQFFNPASRAPHLAETKSHSFDSAHLSRNSGSSAASQPAGWVPQNNTFDPFDAAWAASGRQSATNPFQTNDNVTTAFKVNL